MPPGLGVEGAVPQTIGGPVPVLLELLVAVVVHLAGQGDAPSMVPHCRWPGVRLWLWSEVAVRLDLQLHAELPDMRRQAQTIVARPAVLVCAVSGSSVAVQDEPCLSFTARSSSVSRPRIGRQYVREEAIEVHLLLLQGRPPRTGPRVSPPC